MEKLDQDLKPCNRENLESRPPNWPHKGPGPTEFLCIISILRDLSLSTPSTRPSLIRLSMSLSLENPPAHCAS